MRPVYNKESLIEWDMMMMNSRYTTEVWLVTPQIVQENIMEQNHPDNLLTLSYVHNYKKKTSITNLLTIYD